MSIILGILQKQNQVCESGRQKGSDKAPVHLGKLLSLVTQFLLADVNSAKYNYVSHVTISYKKSWTRKLINDFI